MRPFKETIPLDQARSLIDGVGRESTLRSLQRASLASLEQLPLNRIKLDRSLIAGIDTSARSAASTRTPSGSFTTCGRHCKFCSRTST